jgi:hypothetical protein
MDHVAMGHVPDGDGDKAPGAGQPKSDCAFSAITSAGTLPEQPALEAIAVVRTRALLAKPNVPTIARRPYLQPPLRGPPTLI